MLLRVEAVDAVLRLGGRGHPIVLLSFLLYLHPNLYSVKDVLSETLEGRGGGGGHAFYSNVCVAVLRGRLKAPCCVNFNWRSLKG